MFKDNKGYTAPSVTVLGQEMFADQITTSGELDWGVGDNIFGEEN